MTGLAPREDEQQQQQQIDKQFSQIEHALNSSPWVNETPWLLEKIRTDLVTPENAEGAKWMLQTCIKFLEEGGEEQQDRAIDLIARLLGCFAAATNTYEDCIREDGCEGPGDPFSEEERCELMGLESSELPSSKE